MSILICFLPNSRENTLDIVSPILILSTESFAGQIRDNICKCIEKNLNQTKFDLMSKNKCPPYLGNVISDRYSKPCCNVNVFVYSIPEISMLILQREIE